MSIAIIELPAPRTESDLAEVEQSERQLAVLLQHSSRLHEAHIAHDARSCLVCFGAA